MSPALGESFEERVENLTAKSSHQAEAVAGPPEDLCPRKLKKDVDRARIQLWL